MDLPSAHRFGNIAVRQDDACLAASIWNIDTLQHNASLAAPQGRQNWAGHGAFRLVIYHGRFASGKGAAEHLHVAILVRMDKCSDAKDLRSLAESLQNATVAAVPGLETWTATVKSNMFNLSLTEDTNTRLPSSRTVNGQEMPTPVFAVNDTTVTF